MCLAVEMGEEGGASGETRCAYDKPGIDEKPIKKLKVYDVTSLQDFRRLCALVNKFLLSEQPADRYDILGIFLSFLTGFVGSPPSKVFFEFLGLAIGQVGDLSFESWSVGESHSAGGVAFLCSLTLFTCSKAIAGTLATEHVIKRDYNVYVKRFDAVAPECPPWYTSEWVSEFSNFFVGNASPLIVLCERFRDYETVTLSPSRTKDCFDLLRSRLATRGCRMLLAFHKYFDIFLNTPLASHPLLLPDLIRAKNILLTAKQWSNNRLEFAGLINRDKTVPSGWPGTVPVLYELVFHYISLIEKGYEKYQRRQVSLTEAQEAFVNDVKEQITRKAVGGGRFELTHLFIGGGITKERIAKLEATQVDFSGDF